VPGLTAPGSRPHRAALVRTSGAVRYGGEHIPATGRDFLKSPNGGRTAAGLDPNAPCSAMRLNSRDSLDGCKPGWTASTSYEHLPMDSLPRLMPSSQLLLLDLSNHPGRIPRHDRIRWNTPGDDCPCAHHGIPAYPHPWQEDGTAP
jgi:hypothetical protein